MFWFGGDLRGVVVVVVVVVDKPVWPKGVVGGLLGSEDTPLGGVA